jgi:protein-S-isoprenylcysteine O-methyltransferase Ste14
VNKDHAGVFVPPPIIFALPLLAAVFVNSRLPWPIATGNGTTLMVGGFIAIVTGVSIGLASVFSFRAARTTVLPVGRPTTAIVERGPYRFTRNPMYLAMTLAYVGVSLLLNNVWAVVFLPAVLLVIDVFVIRAEERYLAAKFGESYRSYCARVRRWI